MLIAGVFAAGCLFYYSAPLIRLGDSVKAGTLFLANYHFSTVSEDHFEAARAETFHNVKKHHGKHGKGANSVNMPQVFLMRKTGAG